MKKLTILSFVCLLFAAKTSFAQSGFGIRGGINFSQVYTDAGSIGNDIKQSLDTKTGWSYGVYGRIGRKFFFQPELLVSSMGGSIDVVPISSPNSSPVKIDVKYNNFDVPLLIGIQPIKLFHIMAGPVASFKIGDNQSLNDALKSYTTNFNYTQKSATWGYQVGVGLHLLGMDIDLRRVAGLSEISAFNFQNSQSTQRTAGWQLSVGIKII